MWEPQEVVQWPCAISSDPVKTPRSEEVAGKINEWFQPMTTGQSRNQGNKCPDLTNLPPLHHTCPVQTLHWLTQQKPEGAGVHWWGLYHQMIAFWAGNNVEEDVVCLEGLSHSVNISGTMPSLGRLYWTPALNIRSTAGRSSFHLPFPHPEHLDDYHYNTGLQPSFIFSPFASISL